MSLDSPNLPSVDSWTVDVRKVDLSIELQILAFHEQRKSLVSQGAVS